MVESYAVLRAVTGLPLRKNRCSVRRPQLRIAARRWLPRLAGRGFLPRRARGQRSAYDSSCGGRAAGDTMTRPNADDPRRTSGHPLDAGARPDEVTAGLPVACDLE